ncbi:hypothetical protein XENTR_v10021511 [Xenopus tropicalis]|nr:hypothetical protein XENTR_v10021511 [Xenopus tropicalis]
MLKFTCIQVWTGIHNRPWHFKYTAPQSKSQELINQQIQEYWSAPRSLANYMLQLGIKPKNAYNVHIAIQQVRYTGNMETGSTFHRLTVVEGNLYQMISLLIRASVHKI